MLCIPQKKQPTKSIGKKIKQSIKSNKPGRIYSSLKNEKQNELDSNTSFAIELIQKDPEFIKMVQEEGEKGYTILLILYPICHTKFLHLK